MWAQVVMLMLGAWLWISPFFFAGPTGPLSSTATYDFIFGTLIVIFGFYTCYYKIRFYSALMAAVAVWCLLTGYFGAAHPRPPEAQNQIIVGLLLLMFVIVPPEDKTARAPARY